MNEANAGRFRICVSGGWPVWVELYIDGEKVVQLGAYDLPDLSHAVDRARAIARQALARGGKHEERDV